MSTRTDSVTAASDQEVVNTRLFAARRELVFRAFSDPEQLAQWWGPQGFTNTFHEFDPRPGGHWRFVMQAPDGARYENESDFLEVVEPERIVFDHLEPVHRFLMTMTFDEEGGKTRLTWRMRFESAAEHARVKGFVAAANEENFDRLEAHLGKMAADVDSGAPRSSSR
jgi:uncharacterized protein YndB with AHSA1/START domain